MRFVVFNISPGVIECVLLDGVRILRPFLQDLVVTYCLYSSATTMYVCTGMYEDFDPYLQCSNPILEL